MSSEPKVSVIVRCFNEAKHIGRLLQGISEQTVRDVEIVVVDSGSTDGTTDIVALSPARQISIQPDEFSFGRALNRGCAHARGEILVFASAHVYPVYRDWLERLIAPLNDPQVALAYGRQRGDERSKFAEKQLFAQWFPQRSDLRQSHPFCNNANAAIRRDLWQRLPYAEELTGLEDLHWAERAMSLGHRIAYVAEAEVVHVHQESLAQIENRYRREAIAMKQLYPMQRFGLLDFASLLCRNILSDSYHALREQAFAAHWRDILQFRLMQFWGTYQGFAQQGPVAESLRWRFYYPAGFERGSEQEHGNHGQEAINYGSIGPER